MGCNALSGSTKQCMEALGMKQKILFILLVLGSQIHAQTFMKNYQGYFRGLNLQKAPINRLLDISCPQLDIEKYTGGLGSDTIVLEDAEELLRILEYAKVQEKPDANQWDSLLVWTNEYLKQGIVPILLVDAQCAELSDSFWLGDGYTVNEDSAMLEKKRVLVKSDFNQHNIFMATPMSLRWSANYTRVVLDPRFIFGHHFLDSKIQIGITVNGNETPLIMNQTVALRGIQKGLNICHIWLEADQANYRFLKTNPPVSFSFGMARLFSWSIINIHFNEHEWEKVLFNKPIEQFDVSHNFIGVDGQWMNSGAHITIHFGLNKDTVGIPNRCLRRPLVFVEGIDFGYKGHPTGYRDGKCGNTGYLDLLKGKQWNADGKFWEDWPAIQFTPEIIRMYLDSGLDIVYIDFWDGADYIENNAVVVAEILKKISNRLCGKEIHVLGASMGGLVARSALTLLESDSNAMCIRSFTAFDTPFLGANIPMSLQATMSYFSDFIGLTKDIKVRMLDRPASKQTLFMHYTQIDKPHNLHVQFLSNPSLQLFPIIPYKLAIVNGSDTTKLQKKIDGMDLVPGDLLAQFKFRDGLKQKLTSLAEKTRIKWLFLAALLIPTMDAKLFCHATTLVSGRETKKAVAVFESNIKKDKTWYVDSKGLGYDHLPGSSSSGLAQIGDLSQLAQSFVASKLFCKKTGFVPTWSALNIKDGEKNWRLPLKIQVGRGWQQLHSTPFDVYYSQSKNQDHVFFDSSKLGNTHWLLHQILQLSRSGLTEIKNTVFFGGLRDRFLENVTVFNGGVLKINEWSGSHTISKEDSVTLVGLKRRDFYFGTCTPSTVRVKNGAKIEIGSGSEGKQITTLRLTKSTQLVIEKGGFLRLKPNCSKLIVSSGAELNLKDGSNFIIGEGTSVIIEEGAIIHLGQNVNIRLNGLGAMLHIKGKLILDSNTVLNCIADSGFSMGLMKWSNIGKGYGLFSISGGGNAKLRVKGNDKNTSPVLQIEGKITTIGVIDRVVLERTSIHMGNHSEWRMGGYLSMVDSRVSPTEWAKIGVDGIVFERGNVYLERSDFFNLFNGIRLLDSVRIIKLNKLLFTGCGTALSIYNGGFTLTDSRFKDNIVGLELSGGEDIDSVINTDFINSETVGIAIQPWGSKRSGVFVGGCDFFRNTKAIQCSDRMLAIGCSVFGYNGIGIEINNGNLVMGAGSRILLGNDTIISGSNTFAHSDKYAILLEQSKLYLNGCNNFILSNAKQGSKIQIAGGLNLDTTNTMWSNSRQLFSIGENHWQPTNAKFSMDSIQAKFVHLGYYAVGGKFLEVDITGKLSKTIFTVCFNPYNSLSNGLKMSGVDDFYYDRMIGGIGEINVMNGIENVLPLSFDVFSIQGKLVRHYNHKRDIDDWHYGLSDGIYILRWLDEEGKPQGKKVCTFRN